MEERKYLTQGRRFTEPKSDSPPATKWLSLSTPHIIRSEEYLSADAGEFLHIHCSISRRGSLAIVPLLAYAHITLHQGRESARPKLIFWDVALPTMYSTFPGTEPFQVA